MAGGVSTLCLCSRSCFPACPSVFEGTLAKAVEAQVNPVPKHSSPQISASLKTHRPRAGELLLAWPALPERLCWGSFLQGLPQTPGSSDVLAAISPFCLTLSSLTLGSFLALLWTQLPPPSGRLCAVGGRSSSLDPLLPQPR